MPLYFYPIYLFFQLCAKYSLVNIVFLHLRHFYESLSADTLDDFMRELLAILTSDFLPTPNVEKTQSLAMYVLLSQRLSTHVLSRNKQDIMDVLAKFLQSGNHSFEADALKVSIVHYSHSPY
jgi:septum formation topological specificity factor MinE